jgi:hypothetical protein
MVVLNVIPVFQQMFRFAQLCSSRNASLPYEIFPARNLWYDAERISQYHLREARYEHHTT